VTWVSCHSAARLTTRCQSYQVFSLSQWARRFALGEPFHTLSKILDKAGKAFGGDERPSLIDTSVSDEAKTFLVIDTSKPRLPASTSTTKTSKRKITSKRKTKKKKRKKLTKLITPIDGTTKVSIRFLFI